MVDESATDRIKREARELGFSHVGVARADVLLKERGRLAEWVEAGAHADMQYLSRDIERRTDPREVLPGARSVLVLGFNYDSVHSHPDDPSYGKISRYAWGDDYHDILPSLLEQLEHLIRAEFPGSVCRRYVDTGPVMEKSWAARAGIGWIGKHTNVITRDYGSWIFLGIILTTAELVHDEPATDRCGDCTRCIDACPTAAITAPYVLDARRCISYLTIELRSEKIPGGERMNFENWIFGCDICQDVCPWNRFRKPTGELRLTARRELLSLRLEEVADMTNERYGSLFRRSPVKRAKLAGLRRNARTVLRQHSSNASNQFAP